MSKSVTSVIARLCTAFHKKIEPSMVAEYSSALDDIEPSMVELAVNELIREETWMPTAALVRKTAKKIRAESSDKPAEPEHWRKDSYECLQCRDTGWVTVWHPRTMKAALDFVDKKITEKQFKRIRYEAVAKCTCRTGRSKPHEYVKEYDDRKFIRITAVSFSERDEQLLAWAKNYRPPNHVDVFDQYNEERSCNAETF